MHKVTNSKAQFEYVSKHYTNSKNIFYAPFPSLINDDIKNGKTEVPETKGVTNYILFFGNIHLYKGVDLLYRCYLEHSELHKHKLVLAGNGIYYFPRPTSKEGVIVINRFVDDKELADLFQKAAVVVYPYISATKKATPPTWLAPSKMHSPHKCRVKESTLIYIAGNRSQKAQQLSSTN